jgi:hypothetical protein
MGSSAFVKSPQLEHIHARLRSRSALVPPLSGKPMRLVIWEFDEHVLMRRRVASINDLPIKRGRAQISMAAWVPPRRPPGSQRLGTLRGTRHIWAAQSCTAGLMFDGERRGADLLVQVRVVAGPPSLPSPC